MADYLLNNKRVCRMSILEDFRARSFAEQITILNQIQESRDNSAVPHLFELMKKPLNDTMVDHLVATSLQSLLSYNESIVLGKLRNGDLKEKLLCMNSAAINGFTAAVPLLHEIIEDSTNESLYSDILISLARLKSPESLNIFRKFINYPDELVSTSCIEMLGVFRDTESIEILTSIINNAELDDQYEVCTLQAGMAVQSLASIKTEKALSFLVSKIHHRNATLRRRIQDELIKIGPDVIPFLAPIFLENDNDKKILASNILGFIGSRKGGEILVQALDSGKAVDPNIKYAIYEAFGRIPFLKGLMCLVDALRVEEDGLILLSVVTALNEQVNPGVISAINEIIASDNDQSKRLIRALVSAKATIIFKSIYENEKNTKLILPVIAETKDPETLEAFKSVLSGIDGDRARKDLETLSKADLDTCEKGLLAVDDSKAMLSFYRSIAAEIGFRIMTAMNGKEALDLIESGEEFDLIITDMNMPIMDGIEFTKQLRNSIGYEETPVIMVTTESEQSQRDLAASAGISSFVTKPFTIDIIKEKIDNISGLLSV